MHRITSRTFPELAEVYAAQVIRITGLSLISIFVPIYLLTLGFSLQQALTYSAVQFAVSGVVSILALWLNAKIGIKRTALIGAPFTVLHLLSLYALGNAHVHFLVPAILLGIGSTLHWMPMHFLFTRYSHGEHCGREVSMMFAAMHFFQIIAPSLGGIIATIYGFPALALAALIVVSLSVVPLFMTDDLRGQRRFAWSDLFALRHHRYVGVSLAEGFSTMTLLVFFPLFVYFIADQTTTVGYVKSLEAFISTLGLLAIGRLLDGRDKRKWLTAGTIVLALAIAAVPFFSTTTGVVAISVLLAIAAAAYFMSYDTIFYDHARGLGAVGDTFIVLREIFLNIGRVSAAALAIMLPFTWIFPVTAVALLISAYLYIKS